MPAHQFTSLGTSTPTGGEDVADQPMFANPVLARRKPPRGAISSWMMLIPLGVVLVGGSAYWAVSQMRPQPLADSSTASAPAPAAPVAAASAPAPATVVTQAAATPPAPVVPVVQPARTYAATDRPVVKHTAVVRHRAASDAAADVSATAPQSSDTSASAPATVTTPPPATTQDASPPVITPPAPPSGTP